MTKLSSYMSEAGGRPLPEEALDKTKQHILDTFAAMVSGSELAPGRFGHQICARTRPQKRSPRCGSDVVCGAIEAAFANAMLAHSDEKRMIRTRRRNRIRDLRWYPRPWRPEKQFNIDGPRFLRAVAARLRRRNPRHDDRLEPAVFKPPRTSVHTHGGNLRIGRGCRLRRWFERNARCAG